MRRGRVRGGYAHRVQDRRPASVLTGVGKLLCLFMLVFIRTIIFRYSDVFIDLVLVYTHPFVRQAGQ